MTDSITLCGSCSCATSANAGGEERVGKPGQVFDLRMMRSMFSLLYSTTRSLILYMSTRGLVLMFISM